MLLRLRWWSRGVLMYELLWPMHSPVTGVPSFPWDAFDVSGFS